MGKLDLRTAKRLRKYLKLDPTTGCWLWTGWVSYRGYAGPFFYRGKQYLVHRLMWELSNGKPVPEGMDIHHTCDRKLCENPAHLEAVSRRGHGLRTAELGSNKGEKNGFHKLTDEDVYAIRGLYEMGAEVNDILLWSPIKRPQVWNVLKGKRWNHLPVEKQKEFSNELQKLKSLLFLLLMIFRQRKRKVSRRICEDLLNLLGERIPRLE